MTVMYASRTRSSSPPSRACVAERTLVPFFSKWGYATGDALSLDTLYATAYTYFDDATAIPESTRMRLIRSVISAVMRESGAREAALLAGRRPDESLPSLFVVPNSGGLARLQRGRLDTPSATNVARTLAQVLGPTKSRQLGLGAKLVPEGMSGGGGGGGGGGGSGGGDGGGGGQTP